MLLTLLGHAIALLLWLSSVLAIIVMLLFYYIFSLTAGKRGKVRHMLLKHIIIYYCIIYYILYIIFINIFGLTAAQVAKCGTYSRGTVIVILNLFSKLSL